MGIAPVRLIPSLATPTSPTPPPSCPPPRTPPGARGTARSPTAYGGRPQPDHPPAAAFSSREPGRGAPTTKAASSARSSRCPRRGRRGRRFSRAPGAWGWEPKSRRAFSDPSPNLDFSRQQRVVALESLSGPGRSQPGSSPARAALAKAPGRAARLLPGSACCPAAERPALHIPCGAYQVTNTRPTPNA